MKNDTLYDIGRNNLVVVETLKGNSDDAVVNFMAFHVQQAAELYVKHKLETMGLPYPKSHDISELLEQVPEDVREGWWRTLYAVADTITKYESKTRCVKGYSLGRKRVLEMYTLVYNVYSGVDSEAIEAFEMLKLFAPNTTLDKVQEAIRALGLTGKPLKEHMSELLMEVTK